MSEELQIIQFHRKAGFVFKIYLAVLPAIEKFQKMNFPTCKSVCRRLLKACWSRAWPYFTLAAPWASIRSRRRLFWTRGGITRRWSWFLLCRAAIRPNGGRRRTGFSMNRSNSGRMKWYTYPSTIREAVCSSETAIWSIIVISAFAIIVRTGREGRRIRWDMRRKKRFRLWIWQGRDGQKKAPDNVRGS